MKKKNRSIILTLLIALCIIATLGYYFFGTYFKTSEPNYMTTPVKRGNIEVTVLANGTLKPHRLVAVGARATGRIISMKVQPGSIVKEGDLLAEIDSTTQENDLKSKQAALDNYRGKLDEQNAQLELAEQNLERQKTMIASHAVSYADYDDAAAQVKIRAAQIAQLKAQIIQAEVDVETAKVNLGYTKVTAPANGTVLATVVQEGQNVNAVQSAPTIVILGDLSTMDVRVEISEADIINVLPQQELYFNVIGNPQRIYKSRLDKIEPAPESIRNDISITSSSSVSSSTSSSAIYYNGTFNVPNEDGELRTYMTAEVHIVLGRSENTLLIPAEALSQSRNNKAVVQVLNDDGTVEQKHIEIGLNNKINVEVLKGLDEHDNIIIGAKNGSTSYSGASSSGSRRMGPF